MTIHYFLSAYW